MARKVTSPVDEMANVWKEPQATLTTRRPVMICIHTGSSLKQTYLISFFYTKICKDKIKTHSYTHIARILWRSISFELVQQVNFAGIFSS